MSGEYPANWSEIAARIKLDADWRCERCGLKHDTPSHRVLTVHHLLPDKGNCEWWNLAALCQVCHLVIQAKVDLKQGFLFPERHSEWFKKHLAGYQEALA
ncbi:MAG: HNH endonuclease signature motif containing protein [Nitrospiraceae bacterium]